MKTTTSETYCGCPYINDCEPGIRLRIICEKSNPCLECYTCCHHYAKRKGPSQPESAQDSDAEKLPGNIILRFWWFIRRYKKAS